jgi:hypothetical protein
VTFGPYEMVGSLDFPDSSLAICVEHFGRLERRLSGDGETVRPAQPLFVYIERAPTREEWWEQWRAVHDAQDRSRDLYDALRNPLRAFWVALRRSHLR